MKKARKILVALMAMVMLFGTCMTVNAEGASNPVAAIKSISAKNTTVYTNDGVTAIEVSYKWDNKKGDTTYSAPVGITASSSNRGIVNVVGIEGSEDKVSGKTTTTTTTIKLEAISNGKAKVTITDKVNPKKKKVINVTVKTWANDIELSGKTVEKAEDGTYTVTLANVKGASVNLGAEITNNASDKGIKYAVDKADKNNGVAVDAKGNVKVSKKNPKDATVIVTSKDGKVKETVEVKVVDATVSELAIAQDTKVKNDNTPGVLNGKNTLNMKGNKSSEAYTYQLAWTKGVKAEDLLFVSSKDSVASVDANGKITAKGNGTAKITVSPKLGNKVSKSITVKVTTDVEKVTVASDYFEILANNKATAKIAAKTDDKASNKNVTYKLVSVEVPGQEELVTDNAKMKQYVSLNNKGVVKMKKAATAKISVKAAANNAIEKIVTVTGTVPVSSISLTAKEGYEAIPNKKATAFTVYRTAADDAQDLTLVANVSNEDATNKAVNWKSSKPAIVDVVDGTIVAKGNGQATITATAADGSGKKASVKVTVKTDAYAINMAKAQDGVVYVQGNKDAAKATNYAFNKTIAAATNADASNKNLTYYVVGAENDTKATKVSLKAGEEATIKVVANDTRTYGVASATANPVTENVKIVCLGVDQVASKVEITGLEKFKDPSYLYYAGSSVDLSVGVASAEDGKFVLDKNGAKITTDNKKIAEYKNGKLNFKKSGIVTVTATYGETTDSAAIYVGRNGEDVRKQVVSTFNTVVNAENRDYTGARTKFDGKDTFTLSILDPEKDFTELKNTGLVNTFKSVITDTTDSISYNYFTVANGDDVWSVSINGILSTVSLNGNVVLKDAAADDAMAYVLENCIGEANQWKDWNGKSLVVTVDAWDTVEFADGTVRDYGYRYPYNVNIIMEDSVYDALLDNVIAEQMNGVLVEGANVSYDAANNAVEIVVADGSKSIQAADAEMREAAVNAMKTVFADAAKVTMEAKVNGYTVAPVTKERGNDSDAFINELLDAYVARLVAEQPSGAGVQTLEELDAATMSATVEYQVGSQTYEFKYDVVVVLDDTVYDKAADANIKAEMEKIDFAFGTVNYDDASNTLSVNFAKEYKDLGLIEMAGQGFKTILNAMLQDRVTSAMVITSEGTTKIEIEEDADNAYEILWALAEEGELVSDLDGKTATIKLVYTSANGASKQTLVYQIAYTVEAEAEAAQEVMVEEVAEEVVEETTEEATEETVEETTEEAVEDTVEETTEEVVEETTEEVTEEVVTETTEEVSAEEVAA